MDSMIKVFSIVSSKSDEPVVVMEWKSEKGQLSPAEARMLALNILAAAEAAESDAFMVSFLKKRLDLNDPKAIVQILRDYRQFRADYHTTYAEGPQQAKPHEPERSEPEPTEGTSGGSQRTT